VDPEDLGNHQRSRPAEHHGGKDGQHLGKRVRQGVGDHLADVVEDDSTFFHSSDNGAEVIVEQDQVGCLFSHIGGAPHHHADIGALERRSVIDTVANHGRDLAIGLQGADNTELILRADA